jgi:nucleotide-binding universal stress UspA family protein
MMRAILLAYDASAGARRALDAAADLAAATGASLTVVSVVPLGSDMRVEPWDNVAVHAGELREAAAALDERGIHASIVEPVGNVAVEIEALVREGRFDTVVLGTRRLGPIGRLLVGSVSRHVAANSDATVIIAA